MPIPGTGTTEATDEFITTTPLALMSKGKKAWVTASAAQTLRSNVRRHASRSVASESGDMRPLPALLMSMSSDLKSADTVARQDLIDASDRTSSIRSVMLLFPRRWDILAKLRTVARTWYLGELANSRARDDPRPPSEQPVMRTVLGFTLADCELSICLVRRR